MLTTGVTTAAGTTTFAYVFEDRVASISYPGSGSSSYGYNGLDTRVSASGSFGSRTYRRAGAGVTAPVLGDGVSHFTPGTSVRTGSETRYQHFGLKNIDAQSSGSQSIAATRTYDAFGQTLNSSGSWSGPFGYGGAFGYQSEPDSGLQLLGHRYYDPSAGRFLSRDKARDGGNWYAYCGNGPLTNADPTGLDPIPGVTRPPVPIEGGWKWVPNPKYDPTNQRSRPGKWVPVQPTKGGKGGQPSMSWEKGGRHWDYDDGQGKRIQFEEDGRPIDKGEQHNLKRQGLSSRRPLKESPVPGFARIGLLLLFLLTPPNSGAAACTAMPHPSGKCPHCGHVYPLPKPGR